MTNSISVQPDGLPSVPEWMDLDKIVPPEARFTIPSMIEEAHDLLDTIATFIRDTVPKMRAIDKCVSDANDLDIDWHRRIFELIGYDDVDELVELCEWAIGSITDGSIPDSRADELIKRRLEGSGQDVVVGDILRAQLRGRSESGF